MADEQDRLIARAIESVLGQVPGAIDTSLPEGASAKLQPWAETAAPVGRNKRPLEELLVELEERVAADPGAHATLPRTRHPALAFFDRFGRVSERSPERGGAPGEGSSRRRRRRRGGGGAQATEPTGAAVPATPTDGRPQGGRRRSRRGRGGGATTGAAPAAGAAPRQDSPAAGGQPRAPGSGRRRRGRRGRGGERPPAA